MNTTSLLINYFCLPSYTKITKIEGLKKDLVIIPKEFWGSNRWNYTCDHFCVDSDKAPSKGWIGENGKWTRYLFCVRLFAISGIFMWYFQLLEDEFKTGTNVPGNADNVSAVTVLGIRSFSSEER
jgi:hypothetical protein